MCSRTCLFNDGNDICQATGQKCVPTPECFEEVPAGNSDLLSRGEVEEAFAFLGFKYKPEAMVVGYDQEKP